MAIFDHPWIGLLIAMILGIISKFIWDRYLSKTSRVTRQEFSDAIKWFDKECELRRAGCQEHRWANKAQMENLIQESVNLIKIIQLESDNRMKHIEEAHRNTLLLAKNLEDAVIARKKEIRQILLSIMMVQVQICDMLNQGEMTKGKTVDCSDLNDCLKRLVRDEQ